jgi:hypothetical protein
MRSRTRTSSAGSGSGERGGPPSTGGEGAARARGADSSVPAGRTDGPDRDRSSAGKSEVLGILRSS